MNRLFKLIFFALVGVLTLVILIVGIIILTFVALLSLLRGRKPAMFTTYSRAREFSEKFRGEAFIHPKTTPSANDDVVDVQAHEVRPTLDVPERSEDRPPH
jgi:hypothetical protein